MPQAEGAALRERGYDVYVGGVPAYSTLGWFDDPVLSTFIQYPEAELARLMFHELAHQLLYVKDDTRFNESFAVTVEQAGVERWLAQNGNERERAAYARLQAMRREFVALLVKYRAILEQYYRQDLPPEANAPGQGAALRRNGGGVPRSSRPRGADSPATTAGSPANPTTRPSPRWRSTPNWCRPSARCWRAKAAICRASTPR